MHTPFSIILKRFEVLSDLVNQEGQYSQNLIVGPGRHFEYGAPDTRVLMAEPSPCEAAFEAFLNELPEAMVYALLGLMYSGRDKQPGAPEYWRELRANFDTRDQAVEKLLEKTSRMEYIKEGIALLPTTISLNQVPEQL